MTQSQPWQLVAAREMAVKLRDRNFLIGTLVTMVLIIGMMAFNAYMSEQQSGEETRVVVTSAQGKQLADTLGKAVHAADEDDSVTTTQVADQAAAERLLRDDKADVLLTPQGEGWQLTSTGQPDPTFAGVTRQVLGQQALAATAAKAGTTPQQIAAQTTVTTRALDTDGDEAKMTGMIVGGVFAFLFYMASIMFGMQIAQSVLEEKQSRIVEILAAAIPVRQLLAGKVVGNTVMAVGQMVLYVGIALIGVTFTPFKDMVPALSVGMVWGLAFFLVGFLSLACLWAVAGSLSTRSEDLQQTATPMTMVLMVGFFASFMAKGVWLKALSFLPVLSSMLMPGRLVSGEAAWWEGAVALVLTMAFAAVTMLLGERMYRRSLMHATSRMTYREALRTAD